MADLDLLIRGRRVVGPDGIRPAAVGVRGGQIVIVERDALPEEQRRSLPPDSR